jgi:trehalose-6-phosphatase
MDERPLELQDALAGLDYPATKADVVAQAEQNGADGTMLQTLNDLPERVFAAPEDVTGGIRDRV